MSSVEMLLTANVARLSADEERRIFTALKNARAAIAELSVSKTTLGWRDQYRLDGSRQTVRELEERVIMSNAPLIVHLTAKYSRGLLSQQELVSICLETLVRCVRSYDHESRSGARFSTYAVWSMNRAMVRAKKTERGHWQGRVGGADDTQSVDLVEDERTFDPSLIDLERVMAGNEADLTEDEMNVIKMTFGFGQKPRSMRETAKALDFCPERIRQIRSDALDKLRRVMGAREDDQVV